MSSAEETMALNSDEIAYFNTVTGKLHGLAVIKGWYDEKRSSLECIALMHSELSEAVEEERLGNSRLYYDDDGKPCGTYIELIDAVIRILDYLESEDINVGELLRVKHNYNITRPRRHGNKLY